MTYLDEPPCPVCRNTDVLQTSRTLAGRRYRCNICGARWGVSLEDEVLGMIGDSLRQRRSGNGRYGDSDGA